MAVSYFVLEEDGTSHLDLEESTDSLLLQESGPPNDDFANAQALSTTLPGSLPGLTTLDASFQGSETVDWFSATSRQSIWFTFTPTSTGKYRFSLRNVAPVAGISGDVGIAAYTGAALGSLTLINHVRDTPTTSTPYEDFGLWLDLTASTTYRIAVYSPLFSAEAANTNACNFDFEWAAVSVPSAPANDLLANVQNLGTDPSATPIAGTTAGATSDAIFSYMGPSVYYRFKNNASTTPRPILVQADVVSNSDWFPYWELYKITTDPPTTLAHLTYKGSGGDANIYGAVTADMLAWEIGADYLLVVGSFWQNSSWGDFDLSLVSPTVDAATVVLDLQPSGIDVQSLHAVDASTVPLKLWVLGGECFSTHMGIAMDMEADPRWTMVCDPRWTTDADPRWVVEEIDGQGVHC